MRIIPELFDWNKVFLYTFYMTANKLFRLHPAEKFIEGVEGFCFLKGEKDILDLMGACYQDDVTRALFYESNLDPKFFDLKTGLAGEIMQKLATYRFKVVFVINPDRIGGRFGEFVRESNKGNQFRFVSSRDEALAYL